jgi:hypothetical protein
MSVGPVAAELARIELTPRLSTLSFLCDTGARQFERLILATVSTGDQRVWKLGLACLCQLGLERRIHAPVVNEYRVMHSRPKFTRGPRIRALPDNLVLEIPLSKGFIEQKLCGVRPLGVEVDAD